MHVYPAAKRQLNTILGCVAATAWIYTLTLSWAGTVMTFLISGLILSELHRYGNKRLPQTRRLSLQDAHRLQLIAQNTPWNTDRAHHVLWMLSAPPQATHRIWALREGSTLLLRKEFVHLSMRAQLGTSSRPYDDEPLVK